MPVLIRGSTAASLNKSLSTHFTAALPALIIALVIRIDLSAAHGDTNMVWYHTPNPHKRSWVIRHTFRCKGQAMKIKSTATQLFWQPRTQICTLTFKQALPQGLKQQSSRKSQGCQHLGCKTAIKQQKNRRPVWLPLNDESYGSPAIPNDQLEITGVK